MARSQSGATRASALRAWRRVSPLPDTLQAIELAQRTEDAGRVGALASPRLHQAPLLASL